MRVFVTGASGHIGSAVVPELIGAGHHVVGLARSDSAAAALAGAGAEVWRGDLDDHDGLRAAAADSDGVIHLAFKHDQMRTGRFAEAVEAERAAVEAIADGLAGSGKPFVTTGGTLVLAMARPGRTGTEEDALPGGPRIDTENFVIGLADRGIRSMSIRLAPTVHSDLDHHGFVPTLIGMAREHGAAAYVGDGANRWPAVHTLDAARLYRLALESAPAGTRLHGVGEDGVPFREIAEAIGRNLGVPVESVSPEEAPARFDFLSVFAQLDNPTSSTRTRELLGWTPTHPRLIADIDDGHYFRVPAADPA